MQSNRGRDTKPERALRSAVFARGLRYRVNYRIPGIGAVRRTADIAFTKARLAVFMDGCWWHGCPEHHTVAQTNAKYWADKYEKNRRRDRETDRLLQEAGWRVLRIWEHEDMEQAADRVADMYRDRVDRAAPQRKPKS